MLRCWRNDPGTIKSFIQAHEVTAEEHGRWFERVLVSARQRVMIAELEGTPVGVLRFDWNENHNLCELSLIVAPEHRGKGLGSTIIENGTRYIRNARLIANVKAENEPCRKIFERLGFRVISDKPELICYVKDQGPS